MKFLPGTEEEREIACESLLPSAEKRGWITGAERKAASAALAPEWRRTSLLLRLIGFVTGIVLASALFGLCELFELPAGVLTAIGAIAAAELLILRKRFWRSGIEEALWISGLFSVIIDLPGPPQNEGLLLFAAASLVAAIRLLHPWFAAISIAFVAGYLQSEFGGWSTIALLYAAAALSVILLSKRRRSPMIETFASILAAFAFPPAYILLRLNDLVSSDVAIVAGLLSAAALLGAGLVLRHHAPLFGSLFLFGVVTGDWAATWPLRLEWRFLLCGGVALAAAQLADRMLRGRTKGVTSRREPDIEALEIVQAVSVHAVARAGVDTPAQREGRGGEFGGGGASGDY
jgi:hypothetical protein